MFYTKVIKHFSDAWFNWILFFKNKKNQLNFLLLTIWLIAFVNIFELILKYSAVRKVTVKLYDPLHHYFKPIDFSVLLITLTYVPLLFGIILKIKHPYNFIKIAQSFLLLNFIRACCIYLIPLSPPTNGINLYDPFLYYTFYFNQPIKTDLFFSGHVSNLALMGLYIKNRMIMKIYLLIAVTVGAMLIIQQVHYTIDVLFAPLFSWIIFYLFNKNKFLLI
jgi:hypothetical protein